MVWRPLQSESSSSRGLKVVEATGTGKQSYTVASGRPVGQSGQCNQEPTATGPRPRPLEAGAGSQRMLRGQCAQGKALPLHPIPLSEQSVILRRTERE